MAKEKKPDSEPQPQPSPEELMRARAKLCSDQIRALLIKHKCRIVPILETPEPVGMDGSAAIIRANYGIFPEPPA